MGSISYPLKHERILVVKQVALPYAKKKEDFLLSFCGYRILFYVHATSVFLTPVEAPFQHHFQSISVIYVRLFLNPSH